ncbi:MAG: hypothetical protein ABR909_06855 [Candidatus Bathyarchaeia archaeon]|jgi:hypothetical protein
MIRLLKNHYALATVITTLIILVVSILLAGVLTYFAINVVSTRVQQESLQLSDQHIWITSAGVAEGAIMIKNTGGRDVVISQIQVRGQPCGQIYDLIAATEDKGLTEDLQYIVPTEVPGSPATYNLDNAAVTDFTATLPAAPATGNFVLSSGGTMVVYIIQPDSVSLNDIGLTVGFTVFTAQAIYYTETNVQATTG